MSLKFIETYQKNIELLTEKYKKVFEGKRARKTLKVVNGKLITSVNINVTFKLDRKLEGNYDQVLIEFLALTALNMLREELKLFSNYNKSLQCGLDLATSTQEKLGDLFSNIPVVLEPNINYTFVAAVACNDTRLIKQSFALVVAKPQTKPSIVFNYRF